MMPTDKLKADALAALRHWFLVGESRPSQPRAVTTEAKKRLAAAARALFGEGASNDSK